MKKLFKKKRCKQCGWELSLFSRQSFCSEQCVSVWDQNNREREEYQKQKMLDGLDKVREIRERQKYEELKNKFEDEKGITLTEEQLERLFEKIDGNARKYVELIRREQRETNQKRGEL